MNDKNITMSLNLVNGILNHLGTRPYGEVFQLIQAIQEHVGPQVTATEPEAPAVVD